MSAGRRITAGAIVAAADRIDPCFRDTPQFVAGSLSELLGVEVVVKVETLNPIKSFKGRGGSYFVASNPDLAEVVCASAGNFGQGMAYAAAAAGVPITVFAATTASATKLDAMRALGATVVEDGADFDAAKAAARAYAAARDMRFVEDSRDPEPTIGAGTIGVELLRDGPYDAIVLPVGNGALAAGVGCAVKAAAPATRIIGVCAAAAPAMERSWRTGTVVTTDDANTSADGIAVRVPVPEALTDLAPVLDDFLLVDEDAMLAWVRLAHRHLGVVLEPSGAIGLAAIAANPDRFGGRRVATVLTGGNLSEEQMSLWL